VDQSFRDELNILCGVIACAKYREYLALAGVFPFCGLLCERLFAAETQGGVDSRKKVLTDYLKALNTRK